MIDIPALAGVTHPALSPDGSAIAYVRHGSEEVRGLYVAASDGQNEHRIVPASRNNISEPTWSPDGSRIVFVHNRVGQGELFAVHPDGSNLVQVTHNDEGQDYAPSWSPDGARIAFGRNSGGLTDLYLVNADGSGLERVTDFQVSSNDAGVGGASWSPDGSEILFTKQAGSDRGPTVFSLDVSSLRTTSLGYSVAQGTRMLWSPLEDREVAYVSPGASPSLVFTSIGSDDEEALILPARAVFGSPSWGGWQSSSSQAPSNGRGSQTAGDAPTAETIMRDGQPVGEELAASLGLELRDGFHGQCEYYQEVEASGAGYCLEGLGTTDTVDLYVIAQALRGVILTPEELALARERIAAGGTRNISTDERSTSP